MKGEINLIPGDTAICDIVHRFTYHAPKQEMIPHFNVLRENVRKDR